MPLNIEVGLGPGHIVQHCVRWVPSFTPQGAQLPNFGACLLWPVGYVDQDATWYKGMCLGPGRILLHGDPAPPPKRGTVAQFSAHVYCGQTVAQTSSASVKQKASMLE